MGKNIKFKKVHKIDLQNGILEVKNCSDDFNSYILGLINFVEENDSVRMYQSRSESTEVLNCINNVLERLDVENEEYINSNLEKIVKRLFDKENVKQEQINRLGEKIQKGSLIQALLFDEEQMEYYYLLAKIEHSNYFDEKDYLPHIGFPGDYKKLSKSCLFKYQYNEDVFELMSAKVFLKNKASYWHDEFLELDSINTDEYNTKSTFGYVDKYLQNNIKKNSENDYFLLRNSLIGYMKSNYQFDFDTMVDTLFSNYDYFNLNEFQRDNFIINMKKLPENKKFDKQFCVIAKEVTAKIKKIYKVTNGIELNIKDFVEKPEESISSIIESDGQRYIKIKTDEVETFNTFLNKN